MRLFSTLSLPLFASLSLIPSASSHAAPPNPDQLYALQQAAYLAASSEPSPTSTQISPPPRRHHAHDDKKQQHHRKIKKGLDKRLRKEVEDEWTKDSSAVLQKVKRGGDSKMMLKRQGRMEKLRKRKHSTGAADQHFNRPHSHHVPAYDVQKAQTGPPSAPAKHNELVKRKGGMFKGVSSYYLFALDDGPRRAVLDAIKGGEFSVVRIFLSGVHGNCKGSGNGPVPDLEPDKVGEYDDTILYKIDKLMADCADRGLKLIIALSDRYALGFWSTNSYAVQLNIIQPEQKGSQSLKVRNAGSFYSNAWAIKMFEQRMSHALNHENQLMGGQKWKDLSSVVYAFEAQNEPQGYMETSNPSWVCDRSNFIASQVSGSGIQISSGGGVDIPHSLGSWATDCGSIDIVSVHDYGTNGYNVANALARAQDNHPGKTIMMGEWGLTGANKAAKISEFVSAFESKGIPWMYWQITQPGAGSKDFEVWTGEPAWGALTGGSYSYSSPDSGSSNNYNNNDSGSKSSSKSKSATSTDASQTSDSSSTQDSPSATSKSKSSKSASSSNDNTSTISTNDGSDYSTISADKGGYSTISPDQLSNYSIVGSDSSPPSSGQATKTRSSGKSSPTPSSSKIDSQSDSSTNSTSSSQPEGAYSTIASDDGSQYSTISPDDLSGYSIVGQEDSSVSTSTESVLSSDSTVSASTTSSSDASIPTPTDSSLSPLPTDNSTSPIPSPAGDSNAALSTPTDISSILPSETASTSIDTPSTNLSEPTPTDPALVSTTPTSDQLPTPSPSPLVDSETLPLPNCNYTLPDMVNELVSNGTITVNTTTSIALLPSGIYCNSTILPSHHSVSPDASASPLLVFSSDPSTILPDFSTDSPSTNLPTPETPTATTPTPQENDTALAPPAEAPTPSPSPVEDFHYVTLDANALLTMDLSDYSILPA